MVTIKLAVLGSTKGTDLQYILDAIEDKELESTIEVVISNKEHAGILDRARDHEVEALFLSQKDKTREEFDKEITTICEEKGIDLILLIGYMRILSKEFVNRWKNKILNVHPSLLPKFAGGMDMNVHQAVLDAREKETGMTIHFVDEGADTGPIILQKTVEIEPGETAETLKEKVQKLEGKGFVKVIKLFEEDKIKINDNQVVIEE